MIDSIIQPLEPKDRAGWSSLGDVRATLRSPFPTGSAVGRCSLAEAMWVLAQFGLDGWEEDNHTPDGHVRNFWRPVAEPLIGIECECKDVEAVVVEGDYTSRPLPIKPG